ncbi:MAG: tryptophan-rich sensory protein [bacterium]|nr:tryptophan-rich sensory protein [bacterium]MDT8395540.1 TspO/MBR family protein [bacterium]
MDRYRWAAAFFIFLMMCLGAELTGSLLTAPAIRSGWFEALEKPAFNPPAWVFGPVWTALFFLMAVAAWLVWRQEGEKPVRIPLVAFYIQLVCNVMWSALFFGSMRPGWALAEIVILWGLILITAMLFYRVSRLAGLLFIPYLGWVAFAAVLNGFIWWMNREGVVQVTGMQL